ncbi:MAG: hypothetical protein IJ168_08615 [Eubacterium sp.]|nr:hypothetical protein [Eubacterium sp.]
MKRKKLKHRYYLVSKNEREYKYKNVTYIVESKYELGDILNDRMEQMIQKGIVPLPVIQKDDTMAADTMTSGKEQYAVN